MVQSTQIKAKLKSSCKHILSYPFHPPIALSNHDEGGNAQANRNQGERPSVQLQQFESEVAEYFAMPSALWFPSGTMAQGVALRIHAEQGNNFCVGLHPTSHLLLHEENSYRHVHNLESIEMGDCSRPIQWEDVPQDVSSIIVELPQRHNGGALPQWHEWQDIKRVTSERDIKLHVDGARLWMCRPFFAGHSFADITQGVDSLYVSFYKDLGAQSGAMLLGDKTFIEQAKIWRARMGGSLVSFGNVVNEAYQQFQHRKDTFDTYVFAAREFVSTLPQFKNIWITPNPPHTNMFHIRMDCPEPLVLELRDEVAKQFSVWLADHIRPIIGADGYSIEIVVGDHFMVTPKELLMEAVVYLDQRVTDLKRAI